MTMASDGNSQRTIQEVREYLLERLNSALRRPGMFGGEFALLLFMDAVAFAEGRDRAWRQEHERLRTRGGSGALGVSGMIQQVLGDGFGDARDPMAAVDAQLTSVDAQPAMASVYAEIAHRLGWLALNRALAPADYDEIRRGVGAWGEQDRSLGEVLEVLGPPSVRFGGGNPAYPMTLAYATARTHDPLVCFHLWNGQASDAGPGGRPRYAEPMLLAVRDDDGARFADGFRLTPAGAAHRLTGRGQRDR